MDGWTGAGEQEGKPDIWWPVINMIWVSRDWNLDGGCSAGWLAGLSGWNGL
jgi:hypothetical protein